VVFFFLKSSERSDYPRFFRALVFPSETGGFFCAFFLLFLFFPKFLKKFIFTLFFVTILSLVIWYHNGVQGAFCLPSERARV